MNQAYTEPNMGHELVPIYDRPNITKQEWAAAQAREREIIQAGDALHDMLMVLVGMYPLVAANDVIENWRKLKNEQTR